MSPSGRNVDALKEYQAAGGTGLTLVTLPHKEVPIACGKDFARSYEVTYSLADRAKEETDLEINIAVGPYPILLISLAERYGLQKAEEIMIEGMEYAAKDVAEGRACAIGEIGRPHFPVDKEIWDASNRVLLRGFELARENDVPVIIHCENEPDTDESLALLADKAGLDRGLVVKHSSPRRHAVHPRIQIQSQGGPVQRYRQIHDRDRLHRRSGEAHCHNGGHHRPEEGVRMGGERPGPHGIDL